MMYSYVLARVVPDRESCLKSSGQEISREESP